MAIYGKECYECGIIVIEPWSWISYEGENFCSLDCLRKYRSHGIVVRIIRYMFKSVFGTKFLANEKTEKEAEDEAEKFTKVLEEPIERLRQLEAKVDYLVRITPKEKSKRKRD